jgi:hemerythrin superfamily protein
MATTRKRRAAEGSTEHDAIGMLMADHKKVKKLFSDFKKLKEEGGSDEKAALVDQICTELKVHTAIEEEIFYPAVRNAIDDSDLMDEALVEHAGAKSLIAQLEGEMFKKAKKADLDTTALGAKMLKRKQALMAESGVSTEDEEDEAVEGA